MSEAEFKAGIRDAIEAAFMDGDNNVADSSTTIRRADDGILFIEGEINLTELADAVHTYIVETLAPPF